MVIARARPSIAASRTQFQSPGGPPETQKWTLSYTCTICTIGEVDMPCTLTPLRRRPSAIPLAGILAQLCRRDVYPLSAQRRACIAISCIVVRLKVALQKRTTGSMWTTMFQPWMDDQAVPCSNIIGSEPIPRKEGAGTRCHQLCRVPAGSVAYCAQTQERVVRERVGGSGRELKWELQQGAQQFPFEVWRRGRGRPRRAASLRRGVCSFFA